MFCSNCGKQIDDDSTFCSSCGKRTASTNPVYIQAPDASAAYNQDGIGMPFKKKKSIFKKWWFWVILLLVLFAAFGPDENEENEVPPQKPTESVIQEETEPAVAGNAETENNAGDINEEILEIAVDFIEQNVSENFNGYSISYDDTGITINIWEDGIAFSATYASSGDSDVLEAWDEMIDSLSNMAKNIREYLNTMELNDVLLSINILNDQNKDNILVMIVNDAVVYDVVNSSK